MIAKRQEEKNEKIIRGLMKLPPNRKCINCNSLGPQYVCINFWTFVCTACSGIHREFTHRVKSVSVSKFTTQEVEALQRGGNQCAKEMFLKEWDTQRMRLPDSSNADKIRAFIKDVYLHEKYAGGRTSDKPCQDMQGLKNHEEEKRRSSSYHSFSQSPPYENQYEDRRCRKQTGRRPGSNRGIYEGKISSSVHSTGRLQEHKYEDRSGNSSGSRASDYSISSTGDPFKFHGQSPNFLDGGYSSPYLHQVRDNLVEDAQSRVLNKCSEVNVKRHLDGSPHPQRTASSSSFSSFDSNSVSLKSVNSGSLTDVAMVSPHSSGTQQPLQSTFQSLSYQSASLKARCDNISSLQPPVTSEAPTVDLFDSINNQPLPTTSFEQKTSVLPFSNNEGWATFDVPLHVEPASEKNLGFSVIVPSLEQAVEDSEDELKSMQNKSQWVSFHNSSVDSFWSSTVQHNISLQNEKIHVDKNSLLWNAFDDPKGNISHTLFGGPSHNTELLMPMQTSHTSDDPYAGLRTQEVHFKSGCQKLVMDDTVSDSGLPFNVVTGSSVPPSVLPMKGGITQAQKSTNPFDLSYESDLDAKDAFSDMSSLRAALPNRLPTTEFSGLTQPWFNPSLVSTFIPTIHRGGFEYGGSQMQSSHLPISPTQGPVASPYRNPFA